MFLLLGFVKKDTVSFLDNIIFFFLSLILLLFNNTLSVELGLQFSYPIKDQISMEPLFKKIQFVQFLRHTHGQTGCS